MARHTGCGGEIAAPLQFHAVPLGAGATDEVLNDESRPAGLPRILADGNEYVWAASLLGSIAGATTRTVAHANGLGGVRLLTDTTGSVVLTQQHDAFGSTGIQMGT